MVFAEIAVSQGTIVGISNVDRLGLHLGDAAKIAIVIIVVFLKRFDANNACIELVMV